MRRQFARGAAKMKGNWLTFGRAMGVRFMFAAHAVLAIQTATAVTKSSQYWYLAGMIGVLFIEASITLIKNQGHEYRYFCPSIFIYTCTVVPPVWITEIAMMKNRLWQAYANEHAVCAKYVVRNPNSTLSTGHSTNTSEDYNFLGKSILINTWMQILEQLFLLLLIMGRWMMPKGKLTHNQLSQLLLVYLGDAADMVEFFDAFNEPVVQCTEVVSYLVLAFWSLSLTQFSLVVAENEEKTRKKALAAFTYKERPRLLRWIPFKCTLDVARITLSITLQDGPYLVLRMLLIFHYHLLTYTNLFFTAKNTLVIVLMIYRLLVVQTSKNNTTSAADLENRFCMVAGDMVNIEMANSLYYDQRVATTLRRKKKAQNISAPLLVRSSESRYSLNQNSASAAMNLSMIRREASESTYSLVSHHTYSASPAPPAANERPRSRLISLNCPSMDRKVRTPKRHELDEADEVMDNLSRLLEPSAALTQPNEQTNSSTKLADGDQSRPAKKNSLRMIASKLLRDGAKRSRSDDSGGGDGDKSKVKTTVSASMSADKLRLKPTNADKFRLAKSESDKQLTRSTSPSASLTPTQTDRNGNGSGSDSGRPRLFLKRAYDQRAPTDSSYVEPTLVVVGGKTGRDSTSPQRRSSLGHASNSPLAGLT